MEADATMTNVVIIITFAFEVDGFITEGRRELVIDVFEEGDGVPGDDTPPSCFVVGLLSLVVETEIPASMFVHNTTIHECFFIYGERGLLRKQCFRFF